MKIIITGSLGHIGKPLTQELVQSGNSVTVISSKAEKQAEIEALGAAAAIGSVDDANFLTSTFAGADAVYAMVPPNFGEPDPMAYYKRIGGNYARAISEAGVKRVVFLSSYGADLDHGTGVILGAYYVEQLLNKLSGISLTHLRPGYFYYNLYNFAGMIKEAGFIGANYGGDDKIPMVAPSDIATAAAEELQKTTPGMTVRYVVSDDVTTSEAARALGAAIGKPDLQWVTFNDEQARQGMEQHGIPAGITAILVELGTATHNGILRQDYDRHLPIEMGKVKLEDFAKEFAAAF